MKITRWLLLILLSLAVVSPVRAHKIKLVVWGIEPGVETQNQDARIAAFEQMHPDIEVSALSMGAGSMNPQKLLTAIVGGVPPDLVHQDRFAIGDWASRDAFLPLDNFLTADAEAGGPLAIRQQDYVPATWSETLYHGHVYAIPDGLDVRMLYYNKDLFRQAGLDPNKPPRTWDEMMDDAKKLTIRTPSGDISQIGFVPIYGQGWLYLWSWQEDGEVMSADGRTCTLANPQTVKALTALVSWYDTLGGVDTVNSFAGGFADEAQDPFIQGKLAMKVDGDWVLSSIARYKPDLNFGTVAVPVPTERFLHQGRFKNDPTYVTWAGGFSFAIPRGSQHQREAWEFIQWYNSPEAALIGAKAEAAYEASKGRIFVPGNVANTRATDVVFNAYKNGLPPSIIQAKQLCISLMPFCRFRPVTFTGQLLWDEQVRAVDSAIRHSQSPLAALTIGQENVQHALDAVYNRGEHPILPLLPVAVGVLGLFLVVALFIGFKLWQWMSKNRASTRAEAWAGMLFILPWAFGFLFLTLGPILASLVLSFCDYDVLHPARWAGLANYHALVTTDRQFVLKSMGNAVYLAVIGIPLGMATSLAMALLLNAKLKGQNWYRTAFYIPSIVPVVATSVLWSYILNPDAARGLLNAGWQATITHWFGIPPPGWEAVPDWSKAGLLIMGVWGSGGGLILWLAGLQGIPASLYEAASIDGASAWKQFVHITLPMLSPYIFFNVIMGTIGALQTFDSAYVMGNAGGGSSTGPDDSLLVPVIYLFNEAFTYFKMGYASAIAWFIFVLILGLTLGQLKLAPKWVHYESDTK